LINIAKTLLFVVSLLVLKEE